MNQEANYPFARINKDVNPRKLEIGEYIDAQNLVFYKQNAGVGSTRESMEGTTALSPSLPVGTNKCVGAAWDKVNDVVVFFNQNSNGDHGVYEIDLSDNSITQLQDLSSIDNALSEVDDIAFLGDFIFWTDKFNVPSYLQKDNAAAGDYVSSERSLFLSLIKPTPTTRPEFVNLDTAVITQPNKIFRNGYYFAYRFIFTDGEKSVLSPYSFMVIGNVESDNRINLLIDLTTVIKTFIKSVEVFVKKVNEVEFRRFQVFEITTPASAINVSYTGYDTETTLPDVDSSLLNYDVPAVSNTLSVLKNILLIAYTSAGYDDFGTASLAVVLAFDNSDLQFRNRTWKPKSRRKVGIVYYDKYMKPSFVKSVEEFEVPDINYIQTNFSVAAPDDTEVVLLSNWRNKADVTISGNPPTWAKYYQLYMSEDTVFSDYTMCVANLLFYKRDDTTAGANEIVIRERIYQTVAPIFGTSNTGFRSIDLQIPENLGFTVDTDCFVRILTLTGGLVSLVDNYYPVIEVVGDFVRIAKIEEGDWTSQDLVVGVEIVRFKDVTTDIFYAKSDVYEILSPGSFPIVSVELRGDSRVLNWASSGPTVLDGKEFYFLDANHVNMIAASGFNMTRNASGQFITTALFEGDFNPSSEYYTYYTNRDAPNVIPDHSVTIEDNGWPNTENSDEKVDERQSTLSYSNPFIPDSLVNEINKFLPANKETLALNRGPIVRIVAVDEDVALIIHERTCTSAYIQEGFIKFAEGTDALTKTDEVIAQERKSRSNYGTINPESVAILQNKIEGEAGTSNKVYWWDQNEGVVCRYSLNGIQPISDYGMKDYFKQKSEEMKAESGLFITAGCHPFWDAYIITFPAYSGTDSETWVFSEETNSWIGRIKTTLVPERYVSSGRQLFSFVAGIPYVHNNTTDYNTFYGTTEDASISFIANTFEQFQKIWNYVIMQSNTSAVRVDFDNTEGQSTYIDENEYRTREGDFYADIPRDENTNTDILEVWQTARLHGRRMRSDLMTVTLTFTGSTKWELDSVLIGFRLKKVTK